MLVAAENSGKLIALYSVGFLTQLGGIVLLVTGLAGDIRAARMLRDQTDVEGGPATEITHSAGGVTTTIGGSGMGPLIQSMQRADSFRTFTAERLAGNMAMRILGVLLVVVGTTVDFAADILSAL
jgi:hypothetical protein